MTPVGTAVPEVVEVDLDDLPSSATRVLAVDLEARLGRAVTSVLTTTDPVLLRPRVGDRVERSSRVAFGDRAVVVVEASSWSRLVAVATAREYHPVVGEARVPGAVGVGVVVDEVGEDLLDPGLTVATNADVGELTRRVAVLSAEERESLRVVLSSRFGRWALASVGALTLGPVARSDTLVDGEAVRGFLDTLDDLASGAPLEWVARRFSGRPW